MIGAVDVALHDCGPCDATGDPVRDHLPGYLSAESRAVILARLAHGQAHYGAPLRLGWAPAPVEAVQEAADLVAYLVAARAPEGIVRDASALLDTIMRRGVCR